MVKINIILYACVVITAFSGAVGIVDVPPEQEAGQVEYLIPPPPPPQPNEELIYGYSLPQWDHWMISWNSLQWATYCAGAMGYSTMAWWRYFVEDGGGRFTARQWTNWWLEREEVEHQ